MVNRTPAKLVCEMRSRDSALIAIPALYAVIELVLRLCSSSSSSCSVAMKTLLFRFTLLIDPPTQRMAQATSARDSRADSVKAYNSIVEHLTSLRARPAQLLF